jgi:hypothetical protein
MRLTAYIYTILIITVWTGRQCWGEEVGKRELTVNCEIVELELLSPKYSLLYKLTNVSKHPISVPYDHLYDTYRYVFVIKDGKKVANLAGGIIPDGKKRELMIPPDATIWLLAPLRSNNVFLRNLEKNIVVRHDIFGDIQLPRGKNHKRQK